MNQDIILKAENLYYSYDDDNSHSLNGLSLEIKKGQKIAVMGANGSGKSTFFLCCTGILKPQKGQLFFKGKPYAYDKKSLLELRSKVGIVFQDPDNQLFSASVYQEISFGILNLGVAPEEAKKEVEKVIDYLEITPFRHKPTHALSGGQKKQVSIADILVMHPDIIILDEPAAALDPKHTQMVNHIVDQMTEAGITVLMATHDVDYAYEWADEVILFHEGKVLLHGSPAQVFSNKRVLAQTNLEPPAVLELFESLCRKGILKASLEIPRNLKTLEQYIEEIKLNPHYGGKKPVTAETKKAILAVSFGTSYNDSRRRTIGAIEDALEEAFPEYSVRRGFTSQIIIDRVKSRDQIEIDNVTQALERAASNGVKRLVVQPTHLMNGLEYNDLVDEVAAYSDAFQEVTVGEPLLTSDEDFQKVIQAVVNSTAEYDDGQTAICLMGHGTEAESNQVYGKMQEMFKEAGYVNYYVGTVEASPSLDDVMAAVKEGEYENVVLMPLMIVAGDHANNDMAGDEEGSWKRTFEDAGYQVTCILKGLGELEEIQQIFAEHAQAAMDSLSE